MAETRTILQNPRNIQGNNLVWVIIQPHKITSQSVAARRGTAMETIPTGHQFKLLAPPSMMYTIGHTWGDYESMATRMLSKLSDIAKLKAEVGGLKGGIPDLTDISGGLGNLATGNIKEAAEKAENSLRQLQRNISGVNVARAKVDFPLVYQNSDRRQITLEFKLVATSDSKSDVYDIVHSLELYSCPDYTGSDVEFSPPYIFDIRTTPGSIINIKRAALTSVQPTWEYPYDSQGYPMSCTLTLSFTDMSPLYRITIEEGGFPRITVKEKSRVVGE